jgi:UDP-3-O-[3-hydroxymyristoyl] N-acetylglucosamine deacetylase/3-hydroxyacyl-[acyl-carrier-protein] dehydratase
MAVRKQTTVARAASIKGEALHTGNHVTVTLKPAAADTGYIFKRLDAPDEPTIAAHIDHVKQVERATTLGEGNLKIHTVEHLLSALRGSGIDNALIEIDANEPPIGDGSARIFLQLIEQAGREELEANQHTFSLREPVCVRGKDGGYLAAFPSDKFEISCTNANHTGQHTQYLHWQETGHDYAKEIGQARTFCFYEEVQPLLEKGLIKGGSLENAVVIRGDTVLSREPMRYADEFVRHKILDIIGDLALVPVRLKAHIMAAKAGHALNVELGKAIYKQYKSHQAQVMPLSVMAEDSTSLDVNDVMKIIPHRYPFLLVDKILRIEGETKGVGQKSVTINEPFFQGHFPGHPVMPGVLQLEAMAQVASVILLKQRNTPGRVGYFMSADNVKFRKPVLPGDTLMIHIELTKNRGKIGKALGQCMVNGEVVSEGELTFALIET